MAEIRFGAAHAAAVMAGMLLFAHAAAGAPETVGTTGRGAVPFALAVAPTLEAPGPDRDVVGVRLNLLAGRHRNV